MSQELVNSVNKLSSETTQLLSEYIDAKTTIDGKVASAKADAATATEKADKATTEAASAIQSKNAAAASAALAKNIAEWDQAETAIEDVLDRRYAYAMKKSVFLLTAAITASLYAGSGLAEMGKHYLDPNAKNVNQGMTCQTTNPNVMFLGRSSAHGGVGDSNSDNPIVVISGVELNIDKVVSDRVGFAADILFASGEDGTRTYNAATGVVIQHASSAEAFEGIVNNGNFSNGRTGWHSTGPCATLTPVTNGVQLTKLDKSSTWELTQNGHSVKSGDVYTIKTTFTTLGAKRAGVTMWDQTNGGAIPYSSGNTGWDDYQGAGTYTLEETFVIPDGCELLQFNFIGDPVVTGVDTVVHEVSIMPAAERVITSRQDFVMLEHWHEAVSSNGGADGHKDMVRIYGTPQFGASSYDGIPLRKVSELGYNQRYASFGDWDHTTDGYVAHWSGISKEDKIKLLLDPVHGLYYDDETQTLVQGKCYRFRSIRGLGNNFGVNDYMRVVPQTAAKTAGTLLSYSNSPVNMRVIPQGQREVLVGDGCDLQPTLSTWYGAYNHPNLGNSSTDDPSVWIAESAAAGGYGYNDKCVAIPIALVQRFSQGAHHPTHCPEGCGLWKTLGATGGTKWFTGAGGQPVSKAQAYNKVSETSTGDEVGLVTRSSGIPYGDISSAISGRDGQYDYYDVIHAGLVQDLRPNANKPNENKLRVDSMRQDIAGTKRGKGRVPFLLAPQEIKSSEGDHNAQYINTFGSWSDVWGRYGDPNDTKVYGYLVLSSGRIVRVIFGKSPQGSNKLRAYWANLPAHDVNTPWLNGQGINFVTDAELKAGNWFVVGHSQTVLSEEYDLLPYVNYVCTPSLFLSIYPNGAMGEWLPKIPDGTAKEYEYTRKNASTGAQQAYIASKNGSTWTTGQVEHRQVQNAVYGSFGADWVYMLPFESLSDTTEISDRLKVIGDVGDVFHSMGHLIDYGNRLVPSLIGKVLKSNSPGTNNAPLKKETKTTEFGVNQNGHLDTGTWIGPPKTQITPLGTPTNDSPAVKVLPTLVEDNGLLYMQYHAVELSYDPPAFTTVTDAFSFAAVNNSHYRIADTSSTMYGHTITRIGASVTAGLDGYYVVNGAVFNSSGFDQSAFWVVYNGGWGDDGVVDIVNGESTKTNDNGRTVKVVCHRSIYPVAIA